MLDDGFPNSHQRARLYEILRNIESFHMPKDRLSILENCMVGAYIPRLSMGGSSEDFAFELIAQFSKLYNDDLEGSSILGFINKKLVLNAMCN